MDEKIDEKRSAKESHSSSLLGPIVLIAIGVYFLLENLNALPDLHWDVALRYWPLALIFLGMNVIVRQARSPWGTLLSGLVGLVAIATLALLLIAGSALPLVEAAESPAVKTEEVSYPVGDATSAVVNIDLDRYPVTISALSDSNNLIEGVVAYQDELVFESNIEDGRAFVNLDTQNNLGNPFFWFDPQSWFSSDAGSEWQIGLSPRVPLDLEIDGGSGSARLELGDLSVASLRLDGGSGSTELSLPAGDYNLDYDGGSGSASISFAEGAQPEITVDGGSGSMVFNLPPQAAARFVIESAGSGNFDAGGGLQLMRGEEDEEGTWETNNLDGEQGFITVYLDMGSGSVRVR